MTTLTATDTPNRPRRAERAAPRPAACADLATLVDAAAAGDDAAWRRLVARFEHRLRDVVRPYRLSPADVEDVLQTTWLRLFMHIGQIRDPAAIGGWLATTARRECLRLLQRPLREVLTADPEPGRPREHEGPETELLAAERRATLERALASLPERHRRLMAMLASDPQPGYEQISRTLAIPTGSIGPTRARSLARLLRHPELHRIRPGSG